MCLSGSRRDAGAFQEMFANQMRQAAGGFTDADVGVGLAKIHRKQLRVAIGEMQQADVTETWRVIKSLCNLGARGVKRNAAGGRRRQRP